jgi:hypothetical protein
MLLIHYYALATGAAALTAAWLFRPRERTAVTSLGAFLAWSLTALLGGSTERFDGAVETVETVNNTTLAVQQSGTTVAAPVPDEVRLLAALWALLSALALVLYVLGVYPPVETDGDTP